MGTELRPIPRLSNAQTSIPPPISLSHSSPEFWSTTVNLSSWLGLLLPVRPFICGPHESCVPANPEPSIYHPKNPSAIEKRPTKNITELNIKNPCQRKIYLWWVRLWLFPDHTSCRKFRWHWRKLLPYWPEDRRPCRTASFYFLLSVWVQRRRTYRLSSELPERGEGRERNGKKYFLVQIITGRWERRGRVDMAMKKWAVPRRTVGGD